MEQVLTPGIEQKPEKSWLLRPLFWRITPAILLICLITLLSAGLHLYRIQSIGNSNAYYTAAVKSMLQSWHNFFFVAAEPGGSVTVDKPPLGFWIETAFAAVLGVSGFSVVLPNILAGVISVPLLYSLVKKYFNAEAGLIAALVLALTPVTLAVDRNNTIDGMLILTLLLAAGAFLRATETGRLRDLLLGAFLVGLGFNIKMMQAFLPLPAFYALYLLGSKSTWRRKIGHLLIASALLVVVSFSWAVIVDMTPAGERPYVGSTSTNSEMELIMGYNGVNRLMGMTGGRFRPDSAGRDSRNANSSLRTDGGTTPQNPQGSTNLPQPSAPGNPPQNGSSGFFNFSQSNAGGGGQPNGGGGGMFNTGNPGVFRFFQTPLAKEMSWLLPFGLAGFLLAAGYGFYESGGIRRFSLPAASNSHKGLILWGGWLVTCLVFFSIAGFFHNYYLATISPALAAVVGMGFYVLQKLFTSKRNLAALALLAATGTTIAFQVYLVGLLGLSGAWKTLAPGFFILAVGVTLFCMLRKIKPEPFFRAAGLTALIAMMIIPAVWSVKTVANGSSTSLPESYSGDGSGNRAAFGNMGGGMNNRQPFIDGGTAQEPNPSDSAANRQDAAGLARNQDGGGTSGVSSSMLAYLEENTRDIKYLVAVPSSGTGSNLVLETGRPVLFMGGFSGSDPVVNAESLAKLVADGDLRYILYGGMGGFGGGQSSDGDVRSWILSNCTTVSEFSQSFGGTTLYQCGAGS
jgi:4-amino-4-deoxy-L-arabinose transferase-like glycosyltransferase